MANSATPNGLPVEDPEPLPVGVGRQIRREDADQTKSDEDPAVSPILALAGAQIALGEERCASQQDQSDGESDQGRMGEESGKPARPRIASPR
jgi:hypothetical protein